MGIVDNDGGENRPPISISEMSIDSFMSHITEWANKTFNVHNQASANVGCSRHLQEEAKELTESLADFFYRPHSKTLIAANDELADCVILVLQIAKRHGTGFKELFEAAKAKQNINETREWGEPDERGAVNHIENRT